MPIPKWYLDEPEPVPLQEFYMTAFFRLSTCRAIGMAMGPIPWTAVREYADRAGLEDDVAVSFEGVIYALDDVYSSWREDNKKAREPSGEPPSQGGRERKPKGGIMKKMLGM